jgi:N-acetylglucosaminyl-diphospho-decaprenol L-rhamnosyltransferase
MTPPSVVAIVLNFRLAEATLRCVADLRAGTQVPSLVVVDNGSADGSVERLAATLTPDELVALPANVGYCAAVNHGLAIARQRGARYAWLVNNDVRLGVDVLATLARFLDVDPTVACVAPTMLREDGRVWSEGAEIGFRSNLIRLRRHGETPSPTTRGPEAVAFQPGACALYRLADLAAIGDLDASYFMYWEDADLGTRLWARGAKVVHLPWVRVVHSGAGSSGGGRSPLRKYLCALNSVRYLRRHGTVSQWLALLLVDAWTWPFAFVGGTSLRACLAKGRGLFDGLRGKTATAADVDRYLPLRTREVVAS